MTKSLKTPFSNVSWEGSKYPPVGLFLFFILATVIGFAIVLAIVAFLALQVLAIATTGWTFWPVFWLVLALVILLNNASK